MGRFQPVAWAFDPYVNVLMSSPKAALIPILVLFFGFGRGAVILTVFLYAFFPVVVNTSAGVRQTPRNMIEMAQSFGASEWAVARRVTIPAAAPLVLGGLRFAAARSIKGVIIGEQLISVVGLGALVQRYGVQFQFDQLYAVILLVALSAWCWRAASDGWRRPSCHGRPSFSGPHREQASENHRLYQRQFGLYRRGTAT